MTALAHAFLTGSVCFLLCVTSCFGMQAGLTARTDMPVTSSLPAVIHLLVGLHLSDTAATTLFICQHTPVLYSQGICLLSIPHAAPVAEHAAKAHSRLSALHRCQHTPVACTFRATVRLTVMESTGFMVCVLPLLLLLLRSQQDL